MASEVGTRVKELREAIGLTQEQVAEASGTLARTDVVKVETGHNKATTDRIRAGLGAAFDLGRDDLAAYLDGRIGLTEVLAQRAQAGDGATTPARFVELDLADPDDRWEAAKIFARGSRDDLERDGVTVEQGIEHVEQHQAWSKLPEQTPLALVRLIEDAVKTLAKAKRGQSTEKGRPAEDDELAAPRRGRSG